MGFIKSEANPNLYFFLVESEILILVLYVDDLILASVESLIAGCPFKALYGRKCNTLVSWDNPTDRVVLQPELFKDMEDQMVRIK
jgi:hypothetical protein